MNTSPELRAAVVAAMGRRPARRVAAPLAAGGATAAVAVLAIGVALSVSQRDVEQSAPSPAENSSNYDGQRKLLGVLRTTTTADSDPQVRIVVRDLKRDGSGPRAGRLLGKAPSGSAYVLVPVRRYLKKVDPKANQAVYGRDGLCLFRRGSEGGAGDCLSTAALLAGKAHGALAKQAYGLVPDGVANVRPRPGDPLVPVQRNFYVYDVGSWPRGSIPTPEWLDASGRVVQKKPDPDAPPAHLPRTPKEAFPALKPVATADRTARAVASSQDFTARWIARVELPKQRRAWLVANNSRICLRILSDDRALGGGGCGQFSHLRDGTKVLVGTLTMPGHTFVHALFPDGSGDVNLMVGRDTTPRLPRLKQGVLFEEVDSEPTRLSWIAPSGVRAEYSFGGG